MRYTDPPKQERAGGVAPLVSTAMAGTPDSALLIDSARSGDRRSLARLITLVENGDSTATSILGSAFGSGGTAWTTGLTGPPGAGKSTLADGLITEIETRKTQASYH